MPASSRPTLSRPRTRDRASVRRACSRELQNALFLHRGGGTVPWDRRTLRPPARIWPQCCGRLASADSGAYRRPPDRHRRPRSGACACAAPDCRDGAGNRLPRGSRAWPTGRSDVSDRERMGRSPPNAASRPGVRRTASVTVDVPRASRSSRRGTRRSCRASARRNPVSVCRFAQSSHCNLSYYCVVAVGGMRAVKPAQHWQPTL